MALDTFPSIKPKFGSTCIFAARSLRTDFGDGYSQRAADGLNSVKRTYSMVFKYLDDTDADSIENFLVGKLGYIAFYYTLQGESSARKWICSKWSREPVQVSRYDMNVELEEVFDL